MTRNMVLSHLWAIGNGRVYMGASSTTTKTKHTKIVPMHVTKWSKETKVKSSVHKQFCLMQGKEAYSPKITTPTVKHGAGSIVL